MTFKDVLMLGKLLLFKKKEKKEKTRRSKFYTILWLKHSSKKIIKGFNEIVSLKVPLASNSLLWKGVSQLLSVQLFIVLIHFISWSDRTQWKPFWASIGFFNYMCNQHFSMVLRVVYMIPSFHFISLFLWGSLDGISGEAQGHPVSSQGWEEASLSDAGQALSSWWRTGSCWALCESC